MSEIVEGEEREAQATSNPKSFLESIPIDWLISDVFPKLPIKSIVQYKTACKKWFKLLSDPNFIKDYWKNPSYSTFLVSRFPGAFCGQQFFYLLQVSENGSDSCTWTRINARLLAPDGSNRDPYLFDLQGSYTNGLVCLSYLKFDHRFGIEVVSAFNLMTGDFIKLPQPNYNFSSPFRTVKVLYEVGYISAKSQYKILRILTYKWSSDLKTKFEIFTIGVDDAWRRLPNFFLKNFTFNNDGVIFNDAFHWTPSLSHSELIHTFDFCKERMGPDISVPPSPSNGVRRLLVLDSLSMIDLSGCEFTIWTMKEYGVAESWTKDVVSKSFCPFDVWEQIDCPVARMRNGNLIFLCMDHNSLICFDAKRKKWTEF